MEEASFLSGLAGTPSFVCLILSTLSACQYEHIHLKKTLMITVSDHQWQSLKSSLLFRVDSKIPAEQ